MGAVDHSAQFRRKGLALSISLMFVHMPIVAKKCAVRALNIVRKYFGRGHGNGDMGITIAAWGR